MPLKQAKSVESICKAVKVNADKNGCFFLENVCACGHPLKLLFFVAGVHRSRYSGGVKQCLRFQGLRSMMY